MNEERRQLEIEPRESTFSRWQHQSAVREYETVSEFIEEMVNRRLAKYEETIENDETLRELRREWRTSHNELRRITSRNNYLVDEIQEANSE